MHKNFVVMSLIGLVLTSLNAYAISISSKTEMSNGLRTQLCINGECKTFEKAIGANLSEKSQGEDYLIEVTYLDKTVKIFNWNQNLFVD